jgi:hypothetical protein
MQVSDPLNVQVDSPLGKESQVNAGKEAGLTPEPVLTRWRCERYLPHMEPRSFFLYTLTIFSYPKSYIYKHIDRHVIDYRRGLDW